MRHDTFKLKLAHTCINVLKDELNQTKNEKIEAKMHRPALCDTSPLFNSTLLQLLKKLRVD